MSDKLYKCPECSKSDNGYNWDKATQEFCGIIGILSISEGEFGNFYICPNCDSQVNWDVIEVIENTEVGDSKVEELKQIIDDYFKNVTPEQLKEDLIRNGMKVAPAKYQPATMPKEDIDKFVKILEECGAEIKPTPFTLEEKCEYCEVDVDDRKAFVMVEGHYKIHIGDDGHIKSGEYPEDGIKLNYCPMCGRKL